RKKNIQGMGRLAGKGKGEGVKGRTRRMESETISYSPILSLVARPMTPRLNLIQTLLHLHHELYSWVASA
ncbi:hypothetical protein JB92DRAFT_2897758, partial [Gautieria morchelliformis]